MPHKPGQVLANCLAVLEATGANPDVVRSVVYVLSPDSGVLSEVGDNSTRHRWRRPSRPPAPLGVASLGCHRQVLEVDLTAALPK